jgi:hypothetical protein
MDEKHLPTTNSPLLAKAIDQIQGRGWINGTSRVDDNVYYDIGLS